MRFHLDEQVNPAIAQGLVRRGVDVTTTPGAGLLGAADEAQLAYAFHEGRIIVTHDRDFLRLDAENVQHAGIAYCRPRSRSIGNIVQHLWLSN